jgi:hypothetical protein
MFLPEHSLAFLLGYDGREHTLESGHFLKFDVKQVERSARVPHGLSYSFTFHPPAAPGYWGSTMRTASPQEVTVSSRARWHRIIGIERSTIKGVRTRLGPLKN